MSLHCHMLCSHVTSGWPMTSASLPHSWSVWSNHPLLMTSGASSSTLMMAGPLAHSLTQTHTQTVRAKRPLDGPALPAKALSSVVKCICGLQRDQQQSEATKAVRPQTFRQDNNNGKKTKTDCLSNLNASLRRRGSRPVNHLPFRSDRRRRGGGVRVTETRRENLRKQEGKVTAEGLICR